MDLPNEFYRKVYRDRKFGSDGQSLAVQRGSGHARGSGPRGRCDKREGEPGRPVRGEHERGRRHIPVAFPARSRHRAARKPVLQHEQRRRRQSARTADGSFEAVVAEEDDAGSEREHQSHIENAKSQGDRRLREAILRRQ